MVDLPQIPRRLALFEGGRSSVTGAEVSAVFGRWGTAMTDVASGIETGAEPAAEEAGRKAVTLNDKGEPVVEPMPFLPGKIGDVYRRSAEMAFSIKAETAIDKGILEIRQKTFKPVSEGGFGGDIGMFETTARAYVVDMASRHTGGFQRIAEQIGARTSSQHLQNLMIEKDRRDFQSQDATLKAREAQAESRVQTYVHDGGLMEINPQAAAEWDRLKNIRAQRAADPRSGYTREMMEIDNERTIQSLKGEAIAGHYRREYQRTGDLAGTQRAAENEMRAKGLPESIRTKYLGEISAQNRAAHAMRQEQVRGLTEQAAGVVAMMAHASDPMDPFDPSIDALVGDLRRLGQDRAASTLRGRQLYFQSYGALPPDADMQTRRDTLEWLKNRMEERAQGLPPRPAEDAPPGQVEPGNIDLSKRPTVKNADGSVSTLLSISVSKDGKEYLIPTISPDGKALSEEAAVARFNETGEHLGAFDTPENATAYAKRLSDRQGSSAAVGSFPPVAASGRSVDLSALNPSVVDGLGRAGQILGRSLHITYGIEGRHSHGSQHYQSNAVDIRVRHPDGTPFTPAERAATVDALVAANFTGIHEDADHIHADMRPGPLWRGPTVTAEVADALDRRRFISKADPSTVRRDDAAARSRFADAESQAGIATSFKLAQDEYDQDVRRAWAAMKKAWDEQKTQPTDKEWEDLAVALPLLGDKGLRDEIHARVAALREVSLSIAGAKSLQDVRNILDGQRAAAARGELSPAQRDGLAVLEERAKRDEELLANDPVSYGRRMKADGLPSIDPLDFSSADKLRNGLEARQKMRAIVAAGEPGAGESVLTKTDVTQLAQAMKSPDPVVAATALATTARALTQPEFRAAMAQPEIRDAVVGMANSGDAVKMNAAFGVLEADFQRNPLEFEGTWGPNVRRQLQVWEGKSQFRTGAQIAEEMKLANRPQEIAAREEMNKQADEKLKPVTAEKVVSFFNGWFSSVEAPISDRPGTGAAGLLVDYKNEYRELYARSGGDADVAHRGALKAIQNKWAVSTVGGGRLMAYPPEKAYRPVNGSFDWMHGQIEAQVNVYMRLRGAPPVVLERSGFLAGIRDATRLPGFASIGHKYILISDSTTEAAIGSRRPASYRIVLQTPTGEWEAPTDANHQPMRIYFYRDRAEREAEAAFTDRRAARSEVRGFLGLGR